MTINQTDDKPLPVANCTCALCRQLRAGMAATKALLDVTHPNGANDDHDRTTRQPEGPDGCQKKVDTFPFEIQKQGFMTLLPVSMRKFSNEFPLFSSSGASKRNICHPVDASILRSEIAKQTE
jgi:hypothetical protein